MENRTKTLKGLVLAFYIIAGIFAAIAIFALVYSIIYLRSYTSAYGMGISDLGLEGVQYVLSACCSYVGFAVVIFGIGKVLSKSGIDVKAEKKAEEAPAEPEVIEAPAIEEVPAAEETEEA